jgi:two-component system phosphate regulon response regulator PhoB
MEKRTILVIEDEPDILDVIDFNLRREGFDVVPSGDGDQGLRLAQESIPDLILLDLMLPGRDGLEICRRLRADIATRAIPIIMVTAKGDEGDIVLGLGIGADDYITKPFSVREMLARVKTVMRRGPLVDVGRSRDRIVRDPLIIDKARHEVRINGVLSVFTATEFRLLHFLAAHPGRVFTRNQLLDRVIGEDSDVIDRNIDVHIRAIRKKLGDCASLIQTIRGVGYRFRDEDE